MLDRGEEGVDHWRECLGEPYNIWRHREAIMANIFGRKEDSEEATRAMFASLRDC